MIKRVAQFSAWQAGAQVLSAAMIFVLAAMLPSGPLTLFGYALSISSVLSNFLTLRIEQAILVSKTDEDAAILAWTAHMICLVISALLALAAVIVRSDVGWLPLLAGVLSAASLNAVTVSQQALIRAHRSEHAGRVSALRSALIAGLVLVFAALTTRQSANGALAGLSVGSVIVTITCLRELRWVASPPWNKSKYYGVVREYMDVWSSYLGQSVLSGISLNAPYLALFHAVRPELVASYLLADRIARTPVNLLSISVRSHLTHDYSVLARAGQYKEAGVLMRKWAIWLAGLGLALVFGAGWIIRGIGTHYLSAKWIGAGLAAIVLSPWAASTLSNSPAKAALTASRQNAFVFHIQAAELLSRLVIVATVLPFAADHFFLILFFIHLPGILLNSALHIRASRSWGVVRSDRSAVVRPISAGDA